MTVIEDELVDDELIKKVNRIKKGYVIPFYWFDVVTILTHQSELGINTLMVQQESNFKYWLKVDECTIEAYKKQLGKEE